QGKSNEDMARFGRSSLRGILALAVILGISAAMGAYFPGPSVARAAQKDDLQNSVQQLANVLSIVQQNYAEPINVDQAIYDGAIPGLLQSLDPHSEFFDPKEYAAFLEQEEGRYYGVGMVIEQSPSGQTMVQYPFVESPAYKAGIRPGDVILKVDGKLCAGLNTSEVANLLRGAKGTPVTISLSREGWAKPIDVTVTRAEIPRPAVEFTTMVRPNIGYIRVSTFNDATTDRDFAAALKQLDASKLDGLVVDLRNNGGGLVDQSVGMADMFLDKGDLIVSHRGRSSPERRYYALRGNQGLDVPMVVLINGQTASASEIFAGAMQDHDRALVVGETSFGKGLVGTQFPLSYNTALMLITARYYTPSGRSIQRSYKNETLYDYHYNPQKPESAEAKLTDTGRTVYGGDGIAPDVAVATPKPDEFEELLERRGVLYPASLPPQGVGDFVRFYLGENHDIPKDFAVDDGVIAQLKKFLANQQIQVTDAQIQRNLPYLKWEIQREVSTVVFGVDAGYKIALENDPQLDKAIASIPAAEALYSNARKMLAQRTSSRNVQP
ncbi:MAG: S41 family peptidase, partial [Acidobacteriota bacterium]|nr:S41 family peptidase [Acidobacteriota bacterium]